MGSKKANIECLKQWLTTLKTKKKEETQKSEKVENRVKVKGFNKR